MFYDLKWDNIAFTQDSPQGKSLHEFYDIIGLPSVPPPLVAPKPAITAQKPVIPLCLPKPKAQAPAEKPKPVLPQPPSEKKEKPTYAEASKLWKPRQTISGITCQNIIFPLNGTLPGGPLEIVTVRGTENRTTADGI